MNKSDIKHTFAIFALSLIILSAVVTIAAADTSVAWTKDIGDVTAVDMSEDGSVIYAAVGSQVFVYDAAGVQQNTFTVGGNVVKLVCTADGSKAALYTDGEVVYYIDNGALTWSETFTAITDIDISNTGNVLIIESSIFHKILRDGSIEWESSSGTYNIGVIDPNDEYIIVQSGNTNIQKYTIQSSNEYWDKINYNTYNTNFTDYQNVIVLNTQESDPVIINKFSLDDVTFEGLSTSQSVAISDPSLIMTNSDQYQIDNSWAQATSEANWSARYGAATWVFDGKMWIAGGSSDTRDVWYSENGVDWTLATTQANWTARSYAATWVFDGKMWIAGGSNTRDVWYSYDGVNWVQATTAAGWSGRSGAASWVFDGKMWLAGGSSSSTSYFNDVWYSENGIDWVRTTSAAGWSARGYLVGWAFNDRMWIMGGYYYYFTTIGTGTKLPHYFSYGDIWSSTDGITWTQETSPLGGRYAASVWVTNDRVWLGGGIQNRGTAGTPSWAYINDIWCTLDGVTWTQVTTSAEWSGRAYAATWVYDGKLWLAGGYSPSVTHDVWHDSGIEYIILPHTPQTYIFYNYTGSTPQYTQEIYSNASVFTGSYQAKTKPILSIYTQQASKTLTGNIQAISLSDRGDWLGTVTTSRIYHDQINDAGFSTDYNAALGSTGTVYDVATANGAAMSVVGQGQTTDIYSMSVSRVGTYTAGGAVNHVDIADKNALWAASGGEDGKVYIFSKDASSNWYLEYSSDSENPITALRMSARGEYILAGRTNSLTLYQTNTPVVTQTDFWFTLYAYKDSDSYRNAAVNVSVYSGNQWNSFAQGLTDTAGKYVVQLTAGQTYKFDVGNGQKVVVVMASPSVQSQTVNIHTSPISEAISYKAVWNEEINGIDLKYNDNSGQTNSVTVKVQRTDTWETVYEQTFTDTQNIDEQLPIVDDTTSYKVEFSANRVSGTSRNSFVLSSSRDIIPIPLDQNIKNVLFSCFLIVLAGLFSYMSAIRGALVVAFSATLFVYLGWLTIPWHWLIIAIVIAIVAGFTQRRG